MGYSNLSNLQVLAIFLGKVSPLEMITGGSYDSAKALSSDATGYGCNQCLRNGWVYAVPDSQSWYSQITDEATDYAGECCDTLANCPNAYDAGTGDTVTAGWLASTVTFASVDMAVHACPMKSWKCTNTNSGDRSTTSISNLDYSQYEVVSLTYGFDTTKVITTQDQCSYHISKDKVDSSVYSGYKMIPGYYMTSWSSATSSESLVHYMEWDSEQVTADAVYTEWPSSQSSVAVVDDQSAYTHSTYPDFTEDLDSSSPGTMVRSIPGDMILKGI